MKSCCDLIISISDVYTIDFTKKVLQVSSSRQFTMEGVFLASLLMLYYFKLGEKDKKQITQTTDSLIEQQMYYKHY